MKASSSVSKIKKIMSVILIATTTVAISFLIGYCSGKKPEINAQRIFSHPGKVQILVQKKDLFPDRFLIFLKKKALLDIDITVPSNDSEWGDLIWKSDILIGDEKHIKSAQDLLGKSPLHRWFLKKTSTLISPDFIRSSFTENSTLPLFWNTQNDELQILHLWVPPRGPKPSNEAASLIEQLIQPELQLLWLSEIKWNTTLLILDTANISQDRKSTALRKFDLNKIDKKSD